MGEVNVTQADRDAAATLIEGRSWLISSSQPDWCAIDQKMFREGAKDDHPFVQAFARHRQAAEKAQQERDAGICDTMKVEFADADNAGNDEAEEAWHRGMAHAASRIATAIRSQKDD